MTTARRPPLAPVVSGPCARKHAPAMQALSEAMMKKQQKKAAGSTPTPPARLAARKPAATATAPAPRPAAHNGVVAHIRAPGHEVVDEMSQPRQPHPFHRALIQSQRNEILDSKASRNSIQTSLFLVGRSSSAHALVRKPTMATLAGGAALQLRVPSSSSSLPARQQRRASSIIRCGSARGAATPARSAGGVVEEDHYRTLRLAPGASRREVKKAFHRLALQYHPDVLSLRRDEDDVDFQRINVAYQRVMSNMREAEARLEYWRARYGLADEDLDRYRRYLHEDDQDDWFSDL
uniref:Uncharacterized protein n=1 Tax=Avena sativa TaxID=4498 RepID=A0ACD6AE48_AVESA